MPKIVVSLRSVYHMNEYFGTACDELPSASSGLEPVESSRIEADPASFPTP
jgi:hypothetical protein